MLRLLLATLLFASTASAAVTRVDIIERGELSGYPSYERVVGRIHFAIDPQLAANRLIVDIDLAPRNAQGLVEFTADLYMLKPVDPARGNGTALFEVSNRGGKGMLGMFDLGGKPDPRTAEDLGDPLLFEQGFTLVWVGWEWDVPKRPGMLSTGCAPDSGSYRLGSCRDHPQRAHPSRLTGGPRANSLRGGRPRFRHHDLAG